MITCESHQNIKNVFGLETVEQRFEAIENRNQRKKIPIGYNEKETRWESMIIS